MEVLYAFIDMVLHNNIINDKVINTVIISLKLNNILFNRYANYILYQQLANKIYNKDLSSVTAIKKALLYANLIFSDLIFESEVSISSFETELLRLVPLVENHKNYGEIFFIYTQMSQFYLMLGDLKESRKYTEKGKKIINYADSFLVCYNIGILMPG